ncbi:hypothetical protein ACOME3_010318 [Neoechinorhynchus agilis]
MTNSMVCKRNRKTAKPGIVENLVAEDLDPTIDRILKLTFVQPYQSRYRTNRNTLISYVLFFFFNVVPVVWHGMGDECCSSFHGAGRLVELITKNFHAAQEPVYIYSVGSNLKTINDIFSSYIADMNAFINSTCRILSANPKLSKGFHAVGLSQGGLFLRTLAQRCPSISIANLISIGGPQQGIFGVPKCTTDNPGWLCMALHNIFDYLTRLPLIRKYLVQAQYWHNPQDTWYHQNNKFLAEVNCDRCTRSMIAYWSTLQ